MILSGRLRWWYVAVLLVLGCVGSSSRAPAALAQEPQAASLSAQPPQAQDVITALEQADDKGLSAEDYDGPRWAARLAKLRPFTSDPAEATAPLHSAPAK